MKTSYVKSVIAWYAAIHEFQLSLNIPGFLHRRKRPIVRHSSRTWREVPRAVPELNPYAKALSKAEAEQLRANMCALQNSPASWVHSITSDDILIVLDSGCSIAATNDPTDFDPDTFFPA